MTTPKPPRSVWVYVRGVLVSYTRVPGWTRYDLHRPEVRRTSVGNGGNPGVTMANQLLMRDERFREMLKAKPRRSRRAKGGKR